MRLYHPQRSRAECLQSRALPAGASSAVFPPWRRQDGAVDMASRVTTSRLDASVLAALRRRSQARGTQTTGTRTVDARDVRLRRLPQARRPATESDEEEDGEEDSEDWDSDDEEEEDEKSKVLCCYCCSPRVIVMVFILAMTLAVWACAVYFGVIQHHTKANPRRRPVSWSLWPPKKPADAEEAFHVFDRDGDGLVGLADLEFALKAAKGEKPPEEEVRKYIAQTDRDGDGMLNEDEYLELLRKERKQKADAQAQLRPGAGL